MSHYPSSAELAAFRRATHDANIASVERVTGRPTMTFVHPSASPAWPSERSYGIGFRRTPGTDGGTLNGDVYVFPWDRVNGRVIINTECRREASAMRSRAYLNGCINCGGPVTPEYQPGTCVPWECVTFREPLVYRCATCGHWPEEHDPTENGCAGCDAGGYIESVIEHPYIASTDPNDCD